jgi:Domain of unknown function (DUF5056)
MNKDDDFDKFLTSSFQKGSGNIEDEGFTQRVISNLPKTELVKIKRNYILYLSIILSVLIFFISGGYKPFINAIINTFNNRIFLMKPSIISVFIILVFISVPFFISRIEYNKNTI